jgi:hypothetical protein
MRQKFRQAPPKPKYTPAFSIMKLDGEYEVTIAKMVPLSDKKDKNGNQRYKLEYHTERRPRGYLVETPPTRGGYLRNGSIHISTIEELEELGLTDTEVPLVDEDGEAVGSIPLKVKKEKVNA